MLITVQMTDEAGAVVAQAHTEINPANLILVQRSREALAREKGARWTMGALPFFGTMFKEAYGVPGKEDDADKAMIQMAGSAWLYDHVYCSLTEQQFIDSDLVFKVYPDGAVVCTRNQVS